MQIVNFIKDSTIECSPFTWGLTLFSYGCNFRCKMCRGYNYEKVSDKNNIIGNAIDIIKENITPLHDCVVFLGGEPTIWGGELRQALLYCREIGVHTKIFSNGFLSDTIESINNEHLCDAWSIDFKGLNNIYEEFGIQASDYLINVNYSINDIIRSGLPLEIRTTFYSGNNKWRDNITNYVEKNFLEKDTSGLVKYIRQEDVRDLL